MFWPPLVMVFSIRPDQNVIGVQIFVEQPERLERLGKIVLVLPKKQRTCVKSEMFNSSLGESSIKTRTRRLADWVVICILSAVLAGCQSHYEWHQKLTVVVDTPDGPVSGSSVIEVRARFGQLPMSDVEVWYSVIGEATVVEVVPGRYLFALLNGSEEQYYRAVREQFQGVHRGEWLKRIPAMKGVVRLLKNNYPLLVTFDDFNDPKSVRKVSPRNLPVIFGPGIRIEEITLEITDVSVAVDQINSVLPWINNLGDNMLDSKRYRDSTSDENLANNLTQDAFIRR